MKHLFLSVIMLFTAFSVYAQTEDYPGQSAIGYGYDIFDKYASQESTKGQVFSFSKAGEKKYGYNLPYIISMKNMGNVKDYKITEGSSLKQYSYNLTSSIGMEYDGLLFSGSVETRFGKNSSKLTNNYFYTVSDRTLVWKVQIKQARLDEARIYLTEDAKNAIDKWGVNKLLEEYGTHVVVSGLLGGRMDINLTKTFTSRKEGLSVGATVNASYGSFSGSTSVDYDKSSVNESMKQDITIFAQGGSAYFINKSAMSDNSQYNKWAGTIPEKSTLIDFEKGSLMPIWKLAANSKRENEIKAAFYKKLALHVIPEGNGNAIMMANAVFYVKSKSSNKYWDIKDTGSKLNIAQKDANVNNMQSADRFIKVIMNSANTEYVFLQPQHSDKVITAHKNKLGYHVQIWKWNKQKAAQMFKMIEKYRVKRILIT